MGRTPDALVVGPDEKLRFVYTLSAELLVREDSVVATLHARCFTVQLT
jgi:hypothetical protein